MIKFLRIILLIPAIVLGGFLAVLTTAIWNLPLTFLEWILNLFGDWSLWGFVFGKDVSTFEILYVLSSGIFTSTIALYLGTSMFPYQKHRKKIAYLISVCFLISFSSLEQLKIYEGAVYLYCIKIIGIFIGILLVFQWGRKNKWSFDFVDKIFSRNEFTEDQSIMHTGNTSLIRDSSTEELEKSMGEKNALIKDSDKRATDRKYD